MNLELLELSCPIPIHQIGTFAGLVLSWTTQYNFVSSSSQGVEQSPEVDLSPAVVIALNDADTLSERQGRSDEN